MASTGDLQPSMKIPGASSHTLPPAAAGEAGLRYLKVGSGAPLVLVHTLRTQAEHFHKLIPLVSANYTVYALDLPGMGYSDIVPGASYDEADMRAAVKRLVTGLDLDGVTILGESMGAVLSLTTAADLPERIVRVVAINPYDYAGGIYRSGFLARMIIGGVVAPVIGGMFAASENKMVTKAVMGGGLVDKSALSSDYVNELDQVRKRPGYQTAGRSIWRNLPTLIAARSRYGDIKAPVHLIYGDKDWSRVSDRDANKELLSTAEVTLVPDACHFIALERPAVPAEILNSVAAH